jgi:hypothetical protein
MTATIRPTIKTDRSITLHRDGSISFWDVRLQQWQRRPAAMIRAYELETLSTDERAAVTRHARTHG